MCFLHLLTWQTGAVAQADPGFSTGTPASWETLSPRQNRTVGHFNVWDDHVVSVLYSINIEFYINWFLTVKPALYSWGKSHLIMVYNSYYMLLDLLC